jgi:hypothetical protein
LNFWSQFVNMTGRSYGEHSILGNLKISTRVVT